MIKDTLLIKVAQEAENRWTRKEYISLLERFVGKNTFFEFLNFSEYTRLKKRDFILKTLQNDHQYEILVEMNKRHKFSEELLQELSEVGIDLRSMKKGVEPTQITEPINTSRPEPSPGTAVGQPGPIKDTKQGQTAGNKMRKKIEITQAQASIIAAVIGGLFLIILAFLTPWAEIIVKQPTRTPKATSLAIEQLPFTIFPFDGEHDPNNVGCCTGSAYFKYAINADHLSEYAFDYSLPADSQKLSYAGLAFVFDESQILSEYQNIELTITFSNQANQIEIRFEDIALINEAYRIVGKTNSQNTIIVPLSNFVKTDLKAVRAIDFQVDSHFALGNGTVVIKNIKFTK